MPTAMSCSARGNGSGLSRTRVDHAEDGGVRADPERERQDGDDGEAGMLDELAEAVADVGEHERILTSG